MIINHSTVFIDFVVVIDICSLDVLTSNSNKKRKRKRKEKTHKNSIINHRNKELIERMNDIFYQVFLLLMLKDYFYVMKQLALI